MSTAAATLKAVARRIGQIQPVRLVLIGYVLYTILGWLLLSLPFTHEEGQNPSAIDTLFIATSAVSTTGLVSINPPLVFNFWGELVILTLFQINGIGYMTLGSFVVLLSKRRLSEAREGVAKSTFSLPEGFRMRRFIRHVVAFTFIIEALGAVALYPAFASAGVAERAAEGGIGASFEGPLHLAWQSIYHSVSAFCTAGFSLFPDSLEAYPSHVGINAVISVIALLGAIGFIVLTDAFRSATLRAYKLTLTSKIILIITAWFILGGAVLLFLADPALRELPAEQRVMVAFFQSMTSATTVGFNTFPLAKLGAASVLLMYLLMIIGASPSGTGGGLKSTSVSVMIATVRSTLKCRPHITFLSKEIPAHRITAAFATLTMYVITLLVGGYLLILTESRASAPSRAEGEGPLLIEDVFFEATSALGTVGISRGITGDLTDLGKLIICALMLAGRVGPLTLGLALFSKEPDKALQEAPTNDTKKDKSEPSSKAATPDEQQESEADHDKDEEDTEEEDIAV